MIAILQKNFNFIELLTSLELITIRNSCDEFARW